MSNSKRPKSPGPGMELDAGLLMKQIEFILGATRTGLDIIDADFNIRFIDSEWRKVYGEPAGRKCHQYFMDRDEVCPGCGIVKALATKKPFVTEEILVKEGDRPIQVTTIPFQGPDGEWLVAEVNVDITERKRAEEALRQSEVRYRTLFEDARDGIALAEAETGILVNCNQALCRMVEREKAELVGQQQTILHFPQGDTEGFSLSFRHHQTADPGLAMEDRLLSKSGKSVPVEIRAARIQMGGRDYLLGIFRDITERKRAEEQLRQAHDGLEVRVRERTAELARANEDLVRLNRAKDEFVATVSHELRTPLVTGLGYIEMLLEGHLGPVSPEAVAGLATALRNLRRLSSLINDILSYHSLVGQEREPELEVFHLPGLLSEAVGDFLTRSGKPAGLVSIRAAEGLPPVKANEDLLRQVLANLLDNAGRHAGSGAHIRVEAGTLPDGRVEVAVSDDGAGMPPEIRDAAFEPFVRSPEGGTGLGLPIVRRILDALGSPVKLESEPGRGARVSFVLPAAKYLPPSRTGAPDGFRPAQGVGPAEVLVVDDDADTLDFMRLLLGGGGYSVRTAASAQEALAALAARPADLVLVDLSLPGMDGAELCRRLKSGTAPCRPPVYMFSARAERAARRRAEEAGCDGYLVKPVAAAELLKTVRRALAGRK